MSNSNKAPRTCIITGKGMHEGYLLHTGETIADESSLLVYLKTNHKEEYVNFDSKEGMYSDDFILSDAYEQELYLWTDWYDCDFSEKPLDSNGMPLDAGTDQITNFMYFAYNFPMGWIQEAFGEGTSLANHIDAKWQNLNKRNGHGGTANVFNLFMELSEGNRETLCTWVAENYSHKL